MGVLRNRFFVWFFVCSGFRVVFLGFCGWVAEALCNPAQMRTQDGPAFQGAMFIKLGCLASLVFEFISCGYFDGRFIFIFSTYLSSACACDVRRARRTPRNLIA